MNPIVRSRSTVSLLVRVAPGARDGFMGFSVFGSRWAGRVSGRLPTGPGRPEIGVQVLEQQIPAGDFDVLHQHRRRIDARVLAHESDRAVAIDGELAGPGGTGGEGWLHGLLRVRVEVGGKGVGQAAYRPR